MATMAKSWTDERLEERFDRIDQRFDEVDRRFDEVHRRFDDVGLEFRALRSEMTSRFDANQRLIIQIGGGMLATMIVGFTGVIVTLI